MRVAPSGVVTVTGGKLTTYRRMAADAVDEITKLLDHDGRSPTKRLRLHGADGLGRVRSAACARGPVRRRRPRGARVGPRRAALGEPLVPGLDYLRAEAVYAVRAEMATTVDDVLSRRTRARLLARDASAAAADDVAALIGPELGWDTAEQRAQAEQYRALVQAEREAGELPETALDALLQRPS